MMVIVIGRHQADMCKIAAKDESKQFLQLRGRLYSMYPEHMTRMRIFDAQGVETGSESVVIYAEDSRIPYHDRGLDFSPDMVLARIDEHKLMTGGMFLGNRFARAASSMWRTLTPFLPMIIAGIVLAYAFLGD